MWIPTQVWFSVDNCRFYWFFCIFTVYSCFTTLSKTLIHHFWIKKITLVITYLWFEFAVQKKILLIKSISELNCSSSLRRMRMYVSRLYKLCSVLAVKEVSMCKKYDSQGIERTHLNCAAFSSPLMKRMDAN